ncbi:MAG: hypothetical protein PHP02_06355 [Eubacteriales bacterium]|nr:hypothetical protein [Eubacteriales bacterium]
MMYKRLMITLTLLCLVVAFPALAEQYSFEAFHASLTLPDGVYETVLTPQNLASHEAFIQTQGGTVAAWEADFSARGIWLQAYDQDTDRVLVVSALNDVDGQRYFDINEHPSGVRADYRKSHGRDGAWSVLGYNYDSISWKNFSSGRFLQLRYSYRQGGELVCRGFQRRTIRNGYTITVDMQVYGRNLTSADNTALNKVFDTFGFTQVLPVPELPITLAETVTAPVETYERAFTMKGETKPNAKLSAVVMSFTDTQGHVFNATADRAGKYSLTIELPREGNYLMTLTVESPGLESLSKSYSITYQEGLLPAVITAPPPDLFPQDSFTLMGKTESGVDVTLSVNGALSEKRTGRDGEFSFRMDTAAEGGYSINLTLSKRGFSDRVFSYNASRLISQQARDEALRQTAVSPDYAEVAANPEGYDGQLLAYTGYLVSKEDASGEWILRVALDKTDTGYEREIIITATGDPGFVPGAKVRVYANLVGRNIGQTAAGEEEILPKLQLALIDLAP